VIVILLSPEDWDSWIEIKKTMAMKSGIWPYVNPNGPKGVLQEPVKPIPSFVREMVQAGTGIGTATGAART
jgi:hypothetical protein